MSGDIIELKQVKNIQCLTRNENSVFYGPNEITKTLETMWL